METACLVISKEILGTDRHHYKVRTLAVEFMAANSKLFSPIIANYHSHSLKDHIHQMKVDRVQGTAVEHQAIASLYQVPIKVLTHNTKAPNFRWNSYMPQTDLEKFEQPSYPAMVHGRAPSEYHVELYYHEGCHFDRIAHQVPGKSSVSLPNPLMLDSHIGLLSNNKETAIYLS